MQVLLHFLFAAKNVSIFLSTTLDTRGKARRPSHCERRNDSHYTSSPQLRQAMGIHGLLPCLPGGDVKLKGFASITSLRDKAMPVDFDTGSLVYVCALRTKDEYEASVRVTRSSAASGTHRSFATSERVAQDMALI
uniref:Uncharacterized protein n=1 Tax=Ditylum brightwellii TaxID=49249 RepID=A0A6U3QM53_9STRA|mmetsp:Transcript_21772/g.32390  ORF Transcript_21772/g.32390 Transcript_21772/m.32390 type:complete len:136 (+) Transcript_21772:397-804(+)